jgi:hypothetical protein
MAQPAKTVATLITEFELQVSDVTELSSQEELNLLNRVYQKVCADRPWEFLKTYASGTMSGSGVDGYYITMPTDFGFLYENNTYTENNQANQSNTSPKVIWIGTNKTPYQVINYSDRIKYLGKLGYCYVDYGNSKIWFTGTPESTTYLLDYIKVPAVLTTSDYPIFNGKFHDILVFGMSVANEILQLSPKATSYAVENQALYNQYLLDMQYFYSQYINN